MGATLPVLAALWRPDAARLGRAAGLLYTANTLGAVGGSLATAFLLLPNLGVWRSTLVAALLNAGRRRGRVGLGAYDAGGSGTRAGPGVAAGGPERLDRDRRRPTTCRPAPRWP